MGPNADPDGNPTLIQVIPFDEYFTPHVVPFNPAANQPTLLLTISVVRVVKELVAFVHEPPLFVEY
jgi:hypothetical protein